jgi:nucleotide-binding universal stress UspA family protein
MAIAGLIRRLRDEFTSMPGLHVTEAQVQRLCDVDATTCASALRALVSAGFLKSVEDGAYQRSDLVSHARESRGGVRHSPWRRILCLVEFEDDAAAALRPASHSALRYATTLAGMHRARVTALHAVPRLPPPAALVHGSTVGRNAVSHKRFLEQVTERLRQNVLSNAFRGLIDVHVAIGAPHEELLRMATEVGADLIVLGRGGHTHMESLPRLREVLRDAPCPVLIIHPAGQAAVA